MGILFSVISFIASMLGQGLDPATAGTVIAVLAIPLFALSVFAGAAWKTYDMVFDPMPYDLLKVFRDDLTRALIAAYGEEAQSHSGSPSLSRASVIAKRCVHSV